jgi:hypothetical protein
VALPTASCVDVDRCPLGVTRCGFPRFATRGARARRLERDVTARLGDLREVLSGNPKRAPRGLAGAPGRQAGVPAGQDPRGEVLRGHGPAGNRRVAQAPSGFPNGCVHRARLRCRAPGRAGRTREVRIDAGGRVAVDGADPKRPAADVAGSLRATALPPGHDGQRDGSDVRPSRPSPPPPSLPTKPPTGHARHRGRHPKAAGPAPAIARRAVREDGGSEARAWVRPAASYLWRCGHGLTGPWSGPDPFERTQAFGEDYAWPDRPRFRAS